MMLLPYRDRSRTIGGTARRAPAAARIRSSMPSSPSTLVYDCEPRAVRAAAELWPRPWTLGPVGAKRVRDRELAASQARAILVSSYAALLAAVHR